MREVTGSTWTFQIIIIFILIFACFLTLVLSYSKAYTIKNRMLTVIEKYEGIDNDALGIINAFDNNHGYKTTNKCQVGWIGATDLNGGYEDVTESNKNNKYYYCFKESKTEHGKIKYNIQVFFKFNLPFLGDITTFTINGETKEFIGNNNRIKYNS